MLCVQALDNIYHAALGLRLVAEVQQEVELEALPASRRSLGVTPARMPRAAPSQ